MENKKWYNQEIKEVEVQLQTNQKEGLTRRRSSKETRKIWIKSAKGIKKEENFSKIYGAI